MKQYIQWPLHLHLHKCVLCVAFGTVFRGTPQHAAIVVKLLNPVNVLKMNLVCGQFCGIETANTHTIRETFSTELCALTYYMVQFQHNLSCVLDT